ncbi:hypothetical protein [Stackebrandtia albiflava]|nr:hypothetical protein [Stackebrandtia albiflava]
MIADLEFPAGGLTVQLAEARAMLPDGLLEESGWADELAQCMESEYRHLTMDALQMIGVHAEAEGRDSELPAEYWLRIAQAAHQMDFPAFVPYCLGKARRLPRQDPADVMAAYATMPRVIDVDDALRKPCAVAAETIRRDDPAAEEWLETPDLTALARHLRDGAFDRMGRELSESFSGVFDDLFAAVCDPDFPADRSGHGWAVIGANPFRVVFSDGLLPVSEAEVWWRARD